MALSKEWYNAEFIDSEKETLHRAPSIEYSFYNAVKTGDMDFVIKTVKKTHLYISKEPAFYPEIL